jgi:hypothetical protein
LLTDRDENEQSQQRTFHRYFLPSFGSFDQTVSEEKNLIFFNSFLFFTDLFLLIFKFEKRQRPRLMAVGVIIHGLKSSVVIAHFRPDPLTNMATIDNSCF